MVVMVDVIVIKIDKNGEQYFIEEKRPVIPVIIPRERYLQADIPVFEDRIEYVFI